MNEERRNPVRSGPVETRETFERRITRLEGKYRELEEAFTRMRDEMTRCGIMVGNISTDIDLLRKRLDTGRVPDRYQIRKPGN